MTFSCVDLQRIGARGLYLGMVQIREIELCELQIELCDLQINLIYPTCVITSSEGSCKYDGDLN